MKKLICVLCLFLLAACGPNTRRYEITKADGSVDYVSAETAEIWPDGSLHLRTWDKTIWFNAAIYPKDTYKTCVTMD